MRGPHILKAARGLLGWKQTELQHQSDVSLSTIRRLEVVEGWQNRWDETKSGILNKIQQAFEKNGVEFIEDDEISQTGGPGVRLKE